MNLEINTALAGLNSTLGDYIFLAKKLPEEVLAKKGTSLGMELAARLADLKPAKGFTTADRLAALSNRSSGVVVRPGLIRKLREKYGAYSSPTDKTKRFYRSIEDGEKIKYRSITYGSNGRRAFKRGRKSFVQKGNRLNFQALAVKAELAARESGAGYSSFVARVKGIAQLGAAMASGASKIFSRGRYNQILASAGLSVETDGASLTIIYGSSTGEAGEAVSTPRAQAAIADAINEVTRDMGIYIVRKLTEAGR